MEVRQQCSSAAQLSKLWPEQNELELNMNALCLEAFLPAPELATGMSHQPHLTSDNAQNVLQIPPFSKNTFFFFLSSHYLLD